MRILLITHRFGPEIGAGAESHLWHLAGHLARLGAQVDVATTCAQTIVHPRRFALRWEEPLACGRREHRMAGVDRPITTYRFAVRNLSRWREAWVERRLQRNWEREEMAMEPTIPLPLPLPVRSPVLLTGWHTPEFENNDLVRWTMRRATVQLPALEDGVIHFAAWAPRRLTVEMTHAGVRRQVYRGKGDFEITERLEACSGKSILALDVSPRTRRLDDPRSLGIRVAQVSLTNAGRMELAPLHVDHRPLRAVRRGDFIRAYLERSARRPERLNRLFDLARGPVSPGMARFLASHVHDYDWVIAGTLPYSVIPTAAALRRRRRFRLALLPLFHVDDDLYYWEHYLRALREADCCLANSWFAEEEFYPVVGGKPIRAGAGVDAGLFRSSEVDGARFRKRYGFSTDEKLVLTVGRKAAAKMYTRVIRAVENIQPHVGCRLVMIGPDEDRMPINSPHCSYLGYLSHQDLIDAYDACDAFVLMSESESFGIVFVEAWMRQKAVIGNRNCAPVARLIDHDRTGLLVGDRRELEEALVALLTDPERRERLGRAGLERALRVHTWPAIARGILDYFESQL